MDQNKRLAYFLPNIFTALNMGCGFMAILFSFRGQHYQACMILLLGAIFDSVDGRVARMTGTQSQFGEQFDSLSDLISFGLAPAILYYMRFLSDTGRVGMVVSFLFLLCGALRLARFNANIEKVSSNFFQGLPIPMAAVAMVAPVLLSVDFGEVAGVSALWAAYALFFSLLMVSTIPFPSFKQSKWTKEHRRTVLFIIILILASLFIYEEVMVCVIIWLYVLGSLIYYIKNRKQFKDAFDWSARLDDEFSD